MRAALLLACVAVVSPAHGAPSADIVIAWSPTELGPVGEAISESAGRAGAAFKDESPGAVPLPDPRPLIRRGISAYQSLELDGALTALNDAADLVDQTGAAHVDNATLGDLYVYRAMTLASRDESRSWDDLVTAAGIHPSRVLDPAGLAPATLKRFADAQAEILARPRGKLTLTGPATCEVRIDGTAIKARELELPFGRHWLDASCEGHEPVRHKISVDRVAFEVRLAGKAIKPPDDAALLIQARAAAARAVLVVTLRGDTAVLRKLGIDGKERDRTTIRLTRPDRDRRNVGGAVAELLAPPAAVARPPWYKSRWVWAAAGAVIAGAVLAPFAVRGTGEVPEPVVRPHGVPTGDWQP